MKESKKHKYRIIAVLIAGIAIAAFLKSWKQTNLNGNLLKRSEAGEGSKEIELIARSGREEAEISFSLEEHEYTQEELREQETDFDAQLEKNVLNDNSSFLSITQPLNFVEEISGYPFEMQYHTEPDGLFLRNGEIRQDLSLPVSGTLYIEITCSGYEKTKTVPIMIAEQKEDDFEKRIRSILEDTETETRQSIYMELPDSLEGQKVTYQLKKGKDTYLPLLLLPVAGALFLWGDRFDETEKRKKHKAVLRESYPELAIKISMLIQAGFTPRGAMERIGRQYLNECKEGRRLPNPLYDEIIATLREMGSGISEKDAYENLSNRCSLPEVSRLCSLLIRNLKRGSEGLGNEIRREGHNALLSRKEIFQKRGEIAGTKLLLPMMLYLLIVMVLILYPAFNAFSAF